MACSFFMLPGCAENVFHGFEEVYCRFSVDFFENQIPYSIYRKPKIRVTEPKI
jgi:hypothetical protein